MNNQKPPFLCAQCHNTGLVLAKVNDDTDHGHQYAFRCNACKSAEFKRVSRFIPVWSSERIKNFKIIRGSS